MNVAVGGRATRCLVAGEGPPLLLLHALGENAFDWRWVMSDLSRTRRVYAPDLPGFDREGMPDGDYSAASFAGFFAGFLDALGIERAAVAGNSLGGLVALRLALSSPSRVSALALIGSAGLGRELSPALRMATLPGYGEAAVAWGKTPPGAAQRAWGRALLLFANPGRVPPGWIPEQRRLARTPGFLDAALNALRTHAGPGGQREVLLDRLAQLPVPTLVIWGASDAVVPARQAKEAAARLQNGTLAIIPDCGHLPQVEHPERFATTLGTFLKERDAG